MAEILRKNGTVSRDISKGRAESLSGAAAAVVVIRKARERTWVIAQAAPGDEAWRC